MKLYAVRMRNWIEIREHNKCPRKQQSEAIVDVKAHYGYDRYGHRYKRHGKKFKIKNVIFLGGKVLGCIKRGSYGLLTRQWLEQDEVVEITRGAKEVLAKLGKRVKEENDDD